MAVTDNPPFIFKTDVAAGLYNYFTCTLRGSAHRGIVTGTLYVGFCPGEEAEQQKIQFKWICDGADHPVVVPLWMLPDWGGRLTELSLDVDASGVLSLESGVGGGVASAGPSAKPVSGGPGEPDFFVHIGSPAIVGSLTSWHGP